MHRFSAAWQKDTLLRVQLVPVRHVAANPEVGSHAVVPQTQGPKLGSEPSVFPQSWLHVLVAALQRMPVDGVHIVRPHIQKAGLGTVPFVKAQTGAERHRQTETAEHLAPAPLTAIGRKLFWLSLLSSYTRK